MRSLAFIWSEEKSPCTFAGAFLVTSLTITYFHTGCSTIIGAKLFHGPVRDGKGWYQLAMVIRHNGKGVTRKGVTPNQGEVKIK